MSIASSDDALRACKKTHWPQADNILRTSPPAVTGAARCAWLSGAASARSPSQPASSGPKPLLLSAAAAPPAMLCNFPMSIIRQSSDLFFSFKCLHPLLLVVEPESAQRVKWLHWCRSKWLLLYKVCAIEGRQRHTMLRKADD